MEQDNAHHWQLQKYHNHLKRAKGIWQNKRNPVDIFLSYSPGGSTRREVSLAQCIWDPHFGGRERRNHENNEVHNILKHQTPMCYCREKHQKALKQGW